MAKDRIDQILTLAKREGVLRPRDLKTHGIPRVYLSRLTAAGLLERVGRGLYVAADTDLTEHHTLVEACKRLPHGIVCLLSALRFHDLTTQAPHQVWLAIGRKAWRPRVAYPPIRVMRFSESTLQAGMESHSVEGVTVKVYSAARTVTDCFKYRNKIGLEVALEALQDCWRARRCTMDDLWRYAKMNRVQNVMRPYLESLTR